MSKDKTKNAPPAAVLEAIAEVLGYLWEDEKESYEQHIEENGDGEGHVFTHLTLIDNWMKTFHTPNPSSNNDLENMVAEGARNAFMKAYPELCKTIDTLIENNDLSDAVVNSISRANRHHPLFVGGFQYYIDHKKNRKPHD